MPFDLLAMKADEIFHVGGSAGAGETARDHVLGVETLDVLHAPQQALLEVHHLAGISKEARQFRKRALELACAEAEIACLERDVLGAALFLPKQFAAVDREVTWIGKRIGDHRAIALDLLLARILCRCSKT